MTLRSDLVSVVGEDHVLIDQAATAGYCTDWTRRFSGPAAAVVRPADTAQVAGVMRACHHWDVAVVPQGGNTGLVGGGVPRDGEVVVSLRRLDQVSPVDRAVAAVTVGAGATLAAVQDVARAEGLDVGVDLAARDSATIGGMVATNAGGIRVVAHGPMRQQVIGLEAVLADGTVVRRLPGLAKDNAGYAIPQLLAGSEGTLAVITAVHLRLVAPPGPLTTVLVDCEDVADAQEVLGAVRHCGRLFAAELMFARGLRLVADHMGVGMPTASPTALLVEVEAAPETTASALGDHEAILAQDEQDRRRLWSHREHHSEALNAVGTPVKLDVTIPPTRLPAFVDAISTDRPEAVLFGHLAEGNVHVNLLDPPAGAEEEVLRAVAAHDGSIASEHGIGVAKAAMLHLTRSDGDIAAMWAIKSGLDPRGILNPGVVLARP